MTNRGILLFRKLNHVQLAMPHGGEAAARQFYVGVLGFEEIPKPPELAARGGAWFRSGEAVLHVGVDEPFSPARKAHPALECRDYDGLLRRFADLAVECRPDPIAFEGRPHCYLDDPFGNRIEIIG